ACQRDIDRHNRDRCTEQCVNGSCDGSCRWYTAEKEALETRQSKLLAERHQLQANAGLLDQIRQNVIRDTQAWAAQAKQLIADNTDNEALIQKLQGDLAPLKRQYNGCWGSIPQDCDRPDARGPDGKPLLNGKCEHMHQLCGRLFDG